MEYQIFKDIIIIFALSVLVILIFHRMKIPSIIGFLLTGILAGPHGLKLITSVSEVEILAELGVVLLLFTIGIEFSLSNLLRIKRSVLIGGTMQMILTMAAGYAIGRYFDLPHNKSLFVGFIFSISSTAIVLKLIQERAEVYSPHGSTSLAILIFQDLSVVPLILITPLLGDGGQTNSVSVIEILGKAAAIILVMIVSAKYIVPRLLYQVAKTRSRELFLLTIILLCMSVAWLTHTVGLSPALGAFMAGLVISESQFSHQAFGNILPLRDAFTSFFFVSIGMLLNGSILLQYPLTITIITLAVILLKAIIIICVILALGYPLRTAFLTGLYLFQVGEFAFILAKIGMDINILSELHYQIFLATSIITMALTPLFIAISHRMAEIAVTLPLPRKLIRGFYKMPEMTKKLPDDHLIIIGYGINGRNVARGAEESGINYVVIEMNPVTVKQEQKKGIPIYYGDATHEEILHNVNIEKAKVLVITIADSRAIRQITRIARSLSSGLHIIVRTMFLWDLEPLFKLGADEVIPEEFETSIAIFSRVLTQYHVPGDEIERLIGEIRSDSYGILRDISNNRKRSLPPEG